MRTVPFMLVSLTIIGCGGPNLSGTWVGDFDCGSEGTYDLEITLEKDDKDNTFVGDGEITADDGEVTFEVEVETEGESGEQDLEIELDDCESKSGGETEELTCNDVDDAEWDGEDTITFELGDCDGDVERDD